VRLLVVSPDDETRTSLEATFLEAGAEVTVSSDPTVFLGAQGGALIQQSGAQIVVLSRAPEAVLTSAVEALRRPGMPPLGVLVLDTDLGLNGRGAMLRAGADDCQTRAMPGALIVARARNLLRRAAIAEKTASEALRAGPLDLDPLARTAKLGGNPLRLTRLQFDILLIFAKRGGGSLPIAALSEGIVQEGHNIDRDGLRAAVSSADREILLDGYRLLLSDEEGLRLTEASAEERAPIMALKFLQSFATLISNIRIYKVEHQAIAGAAARAHECLQFFSGLPSAGPDGVRLDLHDGRVSVDSVAHDGATPTPRPVLDAFWAAKTESILVSPWATPNDLVLLAKMIKSDPEDAAKELEALGVSSIRLLRARLVSAVENRAVIERFLGLVGRDPSACADLFSDDAEIVFENRGKKTAAVGRSEIERLLSRFPTGVKIELTSVSGKGEESLAEVVAVDGARPAVRDEYRFIERDGSIRRLTMKSRLKLS